MQKKGWFDLHEFLIALLPVGFGAASLAFQLWGWPRQWDTGLHKAVFIVSVVLFLAVAEALLLYNQSLRHLEPHRREKLGAVLDELIGCHAVDPSGLHNVCANVMRPHVGLRAWLDRRAPIAWPPTKLYIVANSRNMVNAPEAGLPWAHHNGCVGLLWSSGRRYLVADLREGAPAGAYHLSIRQRDLTRDTRIIVSMAILKDTGIRQRFMGVLSLECRDADIARHWLDDDCPENEVKPTEDLLGTLVDAADYIVRRDLIP
jgi:hypothetical protein